MLLEVTIPRAYTLRLFLGAPVGASSHVGGITALLTRHESAAPGKEAEAPYGTLSFITGPHYCFPLSLRHFSPHFCLLPSLLPFHNEGNSPAPAESINARYSFHDFLSSSRDESRAVWLQ